MINKNNFRKSNKCKWNDTIYEVVTTDNTKWNLDDYYVKVKFDNSIVKIPAETFIYKMTKEAGELINNDLDYSRMDLWNIELYLLNEKKIKSISSFVGLIDRIKKILIEFYRFSKYAFDIYDYYYRENEFNLYIRSCSGNLEKACELFFKYRITNKEDCSCLDQYIDEVDPEKVNLRYTMKKSGGRFIGCYHDSIDRLRPLTSKTTKEKVYSIDDLFTVKMYERIPMVYIIGSILNNITEEQIINAFGGTEESIKYIRKRNLQYVNNDNLKDLSEKLKMFLIQCTLNSEKNEEDCKIGREICLKLYDIIQDKINYRIEQVNKDINVSNRIDNAIHDYHTRYIVFSELAYLDKHEYLPSILRLSAQQI